MRGFQCLCALMLCGCALLAGCSNRTKREVTQFTQPKFISRDSVAYIRESYLSVQDDGLASGDWTEDEKYFLEISELGSGNRTTLDSTAKNYIRLLAATHDKVFYYLPETRTLVEHNLSDGKKSSITLPVTDFINISDSLNAYFTPLHLRESVSGRIIGKMPVFPKNYAPVFISSIHDFAIGSYYKGDLALVSDSALYMLPSLDRGGNTVYGGVAQIANQGNGLILRGYSQALYVAMEAGGDAGSYGKIASKEKGYILSDYLPESKMKLFEKWSDTDESNASILVYVDEVKKYEIR